MERKTKKVLITGANFNNKGAQSMLFITVDEVRKRFPNAEIVFQTSETLDLSNYRFEAVNIQWSMMGKGVGVFKRRAVRLVKDSVKRALGRPVRAMSFNRVAKQIENVDMIIDISGFAIGEKWDKGRNLDYIYKLGFAKQNKIPFYIMPQSVGPFNYEKNMGKMEAAQLRRALSDLLKYPRLIYVREKDGVDNLKRLGIHDNVILSSDLVLQNKKIETRNIFKVDPVLHCIDVEIGKNVALVPNFQCLRHGTEKVTLSIYKSVILDIIQKGNELYIIRHSNDDEDLCARLYNLVKSEHVHLINQDLSCIEYDYLIKQFKYVVGSRFHGIVHALRNDVPCIALGWAVKYKELLEAFGMEEYVFDITEQANLEEILRAIDKMELDLESYKRRVTDCRINIQKENCFEFMDRLY